MSVAMPDNTSLITAISVASNSTVQWEFVSKIIDPSDTSAANPNDTAESPVRGPPHPVVLECTIGDLGTNYMGNRDTVTLNGTDYSCQPWAAIAPNSHFYTNASLFPDSSLEDANNFCRNPSADPHGPWCYNNDTTTSGILSVLHCDLPKCEMGKIYQRMECRNKIAAILQRYFQRHFLACILFVLIQISLKFVPGLQMTKCNHWFM